MLNSQPMLYNSVRSLSQEVAGGVLFAAPYLNYSVLLLLLLLFFPAYVIPII